MSPRGQETHSNSPVVDLEGCEEAECCCWAGAGLSFDSEALKSRFGEIYLIFDSKCPPKRLKMSPRGQETNTNGPVLDLEGCEEAESCCRAGAGLSCDSEAPGSRFGDL